MRVLVTYASKHGSTKEIAAFIGEALRQRQLSVDTLEVREVKSVLPYQAVIIGSAVYAGAWRQPAIRFALRHQADLASRKVWLFSSGPVGTRPELTAKGPVHIDQLIEVLKPIEHRIFAGKLDKSVLGFGERAMVHAVGGVEGDFRNWKGMSEWASEIAQLLGPRQNS